MIRKALVFLLIWIGALALLAWNTPSHAYTAVDGDTIKIGGMTTRLKGFDTPETRGALCPAEKAHGLKAKARLQELLDRGPVTIIYALRPDKYGRRLGDLWIAGVPVSDILIREGLAVPYTGRVRRIVNHDWCAALQGRS